MRRSKNRRLPPRELHLVEVDDLRRQSEVKLKAHVHRIGGAVRVAQLTGRGRIRDRYRFELVDRGAAPRLPEPCAQDRLPARVGASDEADVVCATLEQMEQRAPGRLVPPGTPLVVRLEIELAAVGGGDFEHRVTAVRAPGDDLGGDMIGAHLPRR